ncbi:MAG TPA: hypothetical protein VIM33_11455 [Gaiellaceae bacterium]|jgi:hypothetical protein
MRLSRKSCHVAAAALVAGLSTALTADARTAASPGKTIASYCSSSGDVCYGIFNRSGEVYLRITTAARYFKRYNLCVRLLPAGSDATHAQRCGLYPVFRQGGSTWGSSINYTRQFPIKDPGRYRVAWKLGSSALGPPLYFRLPARS